MVRLLITLAGGVLIGVLAMMVVARFDSPGRTAAPDTVVRDIVSVPQMTPAVARKHRDQQYASLTRVAQVMALPTEFARAEALHVLAGRSGSADVQKLIFETNRVADDIERIRLLNVLFFRLAEMDTASALALARTDPFYPTKDIEGAVWRAWARKDLDEALFAAKAETSLARQRSAAQNLYAAFGYMGNDTTERIQEELGIEPDRATRSRYLYQLADRSPTEAISFIDSVEHVTEKHEYVSWLAYYLSRHDPESALRYADLFSDQAYRNMYKNVIDREIARENPYAVLERLMAEGVNRQSSREYSAAISELAANDVDAAKAYFERSTGQIARRTTGAVIAVELAKKSPQEALVWARDNENGRFPYLQMSVLHQIAETDLPLAFQEALKSPGISNGRSLVSSIMQQVAMKNPADADSYLEQIPDSEQRLEASQHFASALMQSDPDAAIAWILSQEDEMAAGLRQMASQALPQIDLEAAIRFLPKLAGPERARMGQRIANRIATNQSPEEAQHFIQQFAGQPGYDELQASVISGVAETDAVAAKQLADQLTNGMAKDRAYTEIIGRRAQTHPDEAAVWLNNVRDENLRGVAAGQLAANWYARDPVVATQWVNSLPGGTLRDDAILQMSVQWRIPKPAHNDLIASMQDQRKRGEAKVRQVYNLMRTDPEKARKRLQDADIPDHRRREIEVMISRNGFRFR